MRTYISGHKRANECHEWPERDTEDDEPLARIPVAQVTEQGRQQHVAANKNRLQ